MIKIDLIAGFLGAGKTTFLRNYAKYLMGQGLRIGILVYDYGAVNVDMLLLNELRGALCELEMVAAGCDADCLNRRFRTKLISMAMSGYDRVIVEPSGVFDMDMFFDTLRDEPLENWYEIGSVVTIVNAMLQNKLTQDEDFVLASQVAGSGCVVFSRTQFATQEKIEETKEHIRRAIAGIKGTLLEDHWIVKNWDLLDDADYKTVKEAGYHRGDYVKISAGREMDFASKCYLDHKVSIARLKDALPDLFQSKKYGDIIRVKGFIVEEDVCYQINASAYEWDINPSDKGQNALIVIGTSIEEELLDTLFQ